MIVVSDTSCITNLIGIGMDHVLPLLFGEVLVPPAVSRELECSHPVLPEYLKTVTVPASRDLDDLRLLLDEGEAEAIQLARLLHADRILIDEAKGRAVASRSGLIVTGVVGVLILAKRAGHVQKVGAQLERLRCEAGFWLSDALVRAACLAAGEGDPFRP